MTPRRRSLVLNLLFALVIIGGAGYAVLQHQKLEDWWRLRNYSPPSSIVTLSDETTMTPESRHLFYVNHPAVEDKDAFYKSCQVTEKTAVLGCYAGNQGIFLLNVQDSQLNGVEEVTAAHEMLHAAYARLGATEKTKIDSLLNQTYQQLNDPRLNAKIALYKQSNADVTNELHSILGTEEVKLPPALESYYKQYFTDRSKITGYFTAYQSVLTAAQDTYNQYKDQINNTVSQVNANNNELDTQSADLKTQQAQLNSLRDGGDLAAYNSAVDGYNQKVQAFNDLVDQTQGLINQYKSLQVQLNQAANAAQELNQALDGRVTTRPTI